MHTHTCIKNGCTNSYQDADVDAYLCPTCLEEKKQIAKEIDARLANRDTTRKPSMLQQYDEANKVRGLVRAGDLLNF